MKFLKTLSSKKVFVHPWETIEIEKVQTPDGKIMDYLISRPNPFVVILLTNRQSEILILKQYKHGAKREIYGFPAGFMKKGEDILQTAKRELLEETGITAKNWKKLGYFYENPTRSPVKFYVLSAVEKSKEYIPEGNPDYVEGDVKTMWASKDELINKLFKKFLSSPMLVALGIYLHSE